MAMQINYMVKLKDAKLGAVRKALTEAGIEVVSVVEVYKEDLSSPAPEPVNQAGE